MMKFWFPDLRQRTYESELMDDPACDPVKLRRTIQQFRVLNRLFTGTRRVIKKNFLPHIRREPHRTFTLLDLGAGGCDLDRWLVDLCRRQGWKIQITALDADPRIVAMAREMNRDYPEITVVQGSALDLDTLGPFDFIFTNHMMHHLSFPDIQTIFRKALTSVRRSLALNDIRRSNWAYLGYSIFTGLFLHGSFTFFDGRLSIRRGFKVGEFQNLLAGLETPFPVQVKKTSPGHLTVCGSLP